MTRLVHKTEHVCILLRKDRSDPTPPLISHDTELADKRLLDQKDGTAFSRTGSDEYPGSKSEVNMKKIQV